MPPPAPLSFSACLHQIRFLCHLFSEAHASPTRPSDGERVCSFLHLRIKRRLVLQSVKPVGLLERLIPDSCAFKSSINKSQR